MGALGKVLLSVGAIVILVGLLLILADRLHLPLGRLPGDIHYRGRNVTFFFPIVTCLLLSLVLSLVLWFINRR